MKKNIETKQKLANALIELMSTKHIENITIKDITKKMNCNRNTFYYHFTSIYDLINWIFEEETKKLLENVNFDDHKKVLETIFIYIEENKQIIGFIYSSIGRDKLRDMLYPYFYEAINEYYKKKKLTNDNEDFKEFIIDFYSAGIANTLIKYINSNSNNKEQIINYLLLTIDNSFYLNK